MLTFASHIAITTSTSLRCRPHRCTTPPARSPVVRCALPPPSGIEVNTTLLTDSVDIGTVFVAPLFEPLNSCIPYDARLVSWLNFRVAVALFVVAPLAIFGGALARGRDDPEHGDALLRIMSGYWQSSALLLVAVLQHAAEQRSAFACGLLVQVVMTAAINWWGDLLAEVDDCDRLLERAFRLWRPAASAATVVGVAVQASFARCALATDCGCEAWWEPPKRLFQLLGGGPSQEVLGGLGTLGMAIYLAYLAYYVTAVLPRVGRSGRRRRDVFTAASVLVWLGILGSWDDEKADSS